MEKKPKMKYYFNEAGMVQLPGKNYVNCQVVNDMELNYFDGVKLSK